MNFQSSKKIQQINWTLLIIVILGSFYISLFYLVTSKSHFPDFGVDYLAWWSAGKIADQKEYSQIYNLDILQSVQVQELKALGLINENENVQIIPNTSPLLSFFIIPFQWLSRINSREGYWIWTVINILVIISYLLFFGRNAGLGQSQSTNEFLLIFLLLFSYPVFSNIGLGQVQTFLLVCIGEFIRNAANKKPIVSGIWLGGLLLKFQLLILIIPVLLIMREWKCLKGFLLSSIVIIGISIYLSGVNGMLALGRLLTGNYLRTTPSNPGVMVNWRMIGVNLNSVSGSPIGWLVSGIGIILTILGVYYLIRHGFQFGSQEWMMMMLGVFTATIAVSWHSHYHLAMVLIPLIITTNIAKKTTDKVMYFWVTLTPTIWLFYLVTASILASSGGINIGEYQGIVIGLTGFVVNIILFAETIRYFVAKNKAIEQNN